MQENKKSPLPFHAFDNVPATLDQRSRLSLCLTTPNYQQRAERSVVGGDLNTWRCSLTTDHCPAPLASVNHSAVAVTAWLFRSILSCYIDIKLTLILSGQRLKKTSPKTYSSVSSKLVCLQITAHF
jgi:hypothetical protein